MALNFANPATQSAEQGQGNTALAVKPLEYNISEDKARMCNTLVGSAEVDALASQIQVYDIQTIVTFGGETAEELGKVADQVMGGMNMAQVNDVGTIVTSLGKIMKQFNPKEVQEDPGVLGKLFGNAKKQLNRFLAKYDTMTKDVERIYVQLKQYEAEIYKSNQSLADMFHANVNRYQLLVKYIMAGDQAIQEIDAYLDQKKNEMASTGNAAIQFEVATLETARGTLAQRVQDLRMAESIAMQSVPMLMSMCNTNAQLARKINSAFIITLPEFKRGLANAIILKRQAIQADSLRSLDAATNEVLLQNARQSADNTRLAAQLATESSVKAETLEETWRIITQGCDDANNITSNAKQKYEDEKKRLAAIKADCQKRGFVMPAAGA